MDKTGLYLGKLAPFHKGHEFVVEKALDEVDNLVILLYDVPSVIDISPLRRKKWIEERYPEVDVRIAWNGPLEEGYNEEIKRKHENYVINRLSEYDFTHFYSSEDYGDHMSKALGAEDIRVDPNRKEVPISGTEIRNDPYANREFLSNRVYYDMLDTISIIGAPSTGKTTLCKSLSEELETEWVSEYGREYWENNDVELPFSKEQMLEVIEKQEDKAIRDCKEAEKYYIIDTNAVTTWAWSMRRHDTSLPELRQKASTVGSRYDYIFLCNDDIPFEEEEGRMSEKDRTAMQRMHEAFLNENDINYNIVSGDLDNRVQEVKEHIGV